MTDIGSLLHERYETRGVLRNTYDAAENIAVLEAALAEHAAAARRPADDGIIDTIAVEMFCDGDSVNLTARELRVAATVMRLRRYSTAEIARRCGVSETTVTRWEDEGTS